MSKKTYRYRTAMRCIIECSTPLAISNGEKDINTDSQVTLDVNGLPYIPGTSLAGIMRHALKGSVAESIFGFQGDREKGGEGAKLIFSDGCLLAEDGSVVEGLVDVKDLEKEFFQYFQALPIRQHCRINAKGSTADGGKFDQQIVFKGARFCFELELISDELADLSVFDKIAVELQNKLLRVGGGTRSGFGAVKLIEAKRMNFDLKEREDLNLYINKTASLNDAIWFGKQAENCLKEFDKEQKLYHLRLVPDDFFLFGAGFGDNEVDMVPVKESMIVWNNGKASFTTAANTVLIPASSFKGALAHRTAFHYNAAKGWFADNNEGKESDENPAVLVLFGSEGKVDECKLRGNLIFSDIIELVEKKDKILNHVSIDRFTGGAIDGALFSEKVNFTPSVTYTTDILLDVDGLRRAIKCFADLREEDVIAAFEKALDDLCTGRLPLGGGVMRGNGCFTGTYN